MENMKIFFEFQTPHLRLEGLEWLQTPPPLSNDYTNLPILVAILRETGSGFWKKNWKNAIYHLQIMMTFISLHFWCNCFCFNIF